MAGSQDPAVFLGLDGKELPDRPIELAYAIVAAFAGRIGGIVTSVFKALVTGTVDLLLVSLTAAVFF